jgi:hypothetical protein
MRDIDVMVPEEALSAAEATLAKVGYVEDESYRPARWYREHHHHLVPRLDRATGVVVEIHRNVVAPNQSFRLDPRGFWQRAQPQSVAGAEVLALSPEDTVIHLCLHTACDDPFAGKIRSVADLAQFAARRGSQLKWDAVVERSVHYGIARFIHYVLQYAASECGLAMPEPARRTIRDAAATDPFSDRLLRWIIAFCIFRDDDRQRVLPDWRLQKACEAMLHAKGSLGRMTALIGWSPTPCKRSRSSHMSRLAGRDAVPSRLLRTTGLASSSKSSPTDLSNQPAGDRKIIG